MDMNEDLFYSILPFVPHTAQACTSVCKDWKNNITSQVIVKLIRQDPFISQTIKTLINILIEKCGKQFVKSFSALLIYGVLTRKEIMGSMKLLHPMNNESEFKKQINLLFNCLTTEESQQWHENIDICKPSYPSLVPVLNECFLLTTFSHWRGRPTKSFIAKEEQMTPLKDRKEIVLDFPKYRTDSQVDVATMLVGRSVRCNKHIGEVSFIKESFSDRYFHLVAEKSLFSETWRFGESNGVTFADSPTRCSFCTREKNNNTSTKLKACPCMRVQYCFNLTTKGSDCQQKHWKVEHKKHHKECMLKMARNTKEETFLNIPIYFSPQVAVHLYLVDHPRVGNIHHFFLYHTDHSGKKDLMDEAVLNIHQGVYQFGLNKALHPELPSIAKETETDTNTDTEETKTENENETENERKAPLPLPLEFAGLLADVNGLAADQLLSPHSTAGKYEIWGKARADITEKFHSILESRSSIRGNEGTKVHYDGLLECAEFHIRSCSSYTNEHGIIQQRKILPCHERLLIARTILNEIECNISQHILFYGKHLIFKHNISEKDFVQNIGPSKHSINETKVPMNFVKSFLNTPFGDQRMKNVEIKQEDTNNNSDMKMLSCIARMCYLHSYMDWNGGDHLTGIYYGVLASCFHERIHHYYYQNGIKKGATMAMNEINSLFQVADSFAKLGLNLVDMNPKDPFYYDDYSNTLPSIAFNIALSYYTKLLELGSVKQRLFLERKVNQLKGRTLNDLARCKNASPKVKLKILMKALDLRQKYFGEMSLPTAQSCLTVGQVLLELQKPIASLPFLAKSFQIRTKTLSGNNNSFIENSKSTLAFALFSIIKNRNRWINMETGKPVITDEDEKILNRVIGKLNLNLFQQPSTSNFSSWWENEGRQDSEMDKEIYTTEINCVMDFWGKFKEFENDAL